ncbi:putative Fe-S center protein [Legionella sainthelensi]|uniref:Putative Fe-S center protein n=2 Tax=Legionella sainthelensi TaxID=28087 RepID=A0A0W0YNV7_9GAMM|nr:putative Fe-S center protein [Legionella sainthelensi]VEH27700.1 putative Fe-S center protein [Legionella sainthelensi]
MSKKFAKQGSHYTAVVIYFNTWLDFFCQNHFLRHSYILSVTLHKDYGYNDCAYLIFLRLKMNALNLAIKEALLSAGNSKEVNKAYLEFIKANFIIPIEQSTDEEQPKVLFLQENGHVFLPVFTEISYLNSWALEIAEEIKLLKLSGVDLLKGLGDDVTVCLNIGSEIYKEFNPSEITRMRSIVLKLFKK